MKYGLQWDAIYGSGVSNATDAQALIWDETNHNWEPGTVAGGGYSTIEEDGVPLTQRTTINFVGASVTAADSGGKTVVTITAGGPGGDSSISRHFLFMGS